MALSRRRAPLRVAVNQGVARGSTPATSRGSARSGSRRSTESSGFTASKTDFGSSAPGSASAASASAAPSSAAPSSAAPTAPVTTPAPAPTYDLFRLFMQAYMEDRRNHTPALAPAFLAEPRENVSDRLLKTRNPDLFYGNSYMECYHFCQQFEYHFDTDGAKSHKHVHFAASFLKDFILHRWQQYKTRTKRNRAAPLSWKEFKVFLRQSLGESDAFVGNVWSKMRSDSQHPLEEVQDWVAHLEQSQSILLEFDVDCAPLEGQLGRAFYHWFRPSIKLWIDKVGRQQLPWDKQVKAARTAEAKACIHNNQHLDQRCPKGKWPLKLTLKDSNEHSSEKTKTALPQKKSAGSP